jgi:hypothetical protein
MNRPWATLQAADDETRFQQWHRVWASSSSSSSSSSATQQYHGQYVGLYSRKPVGQPTWPSCNNSTSYYRVMFRPLAPLWRLAHMYMTLVSGLWMLNGHCSTLVAPTPKPSRGKEKRHKLVSSSPASSSSTSASEHSTPRHICVESTVSSTALQPRQACRGSLARVALSEDASMPFSATLTRRLGCWGCCTGNASGAEPKASRRLKRNRACSVAVSGSYHSFSLLIIICALARWNSTVSRKGNGRDHRDKGRRRLQNRKRHPARVLAVDSTTDATVSVLDVWLLIDGLAVGARRLLV